MLVRALKLQLAERATQVSALEALLTQKWSANVVNGQTVLTAAEAGGSLTFTFDRAYTPGELAMAGIPGDKSLAESGNGRPQSNGTSRAPEDLTRPPPNGPRPRPCARAAGRWRSP
jgi:hypothetical protein